MLRTNEIRIIPQFSGQTEIDDSELKLRSGYLVYTSSIGGGTVNEFTVRDFLDNPNNENIAVQFFNYLQSNFSKPEFNELYYNNTKLANVFNDYYDKIINKNTKPTLSAAKLQLTATTAITYTNTTFVTPTLRSNKKITVVLGYNTGDSYYINVPIWTSSNILDNSNYDKYRRDSLGPTVSAETAEQFRYAVKKGTTISNPNVIINTNSFDDYFPLYPLPFNDTKLKIQFKKDKHIIKKNNMNKFIPIEIVFDKAAPINGQFFQLLIESAFGSDASAETPTGIDNAYSGTGKSMPPSIGSEISLVDGNNQNLVFKNFVINSGQTSINAIVELKSQRLMEMNNLEINLKLLSQCNLDFNQYAPLQLYTVSEKTFKIISEQSATLDFNVNTSIDYVKVNHKISPQIFLQSFVNLNFNDSESEFWLNPSTSGAIPGLVVASPPPPPPIPPPPKQHSGTSQSSFDITKNTLYALLLKLGYAIKSQSGPSGSVVVMKAANSALDFVFNVTFSPPSKSKQKKAEYIVRGYDTITFDATDSVQTLQILETLNQFFAPFPIQNF